MASACVDGSAIEISVFECVHLSGTRYCFGVEGGWYLVELYDDPRHRKTSVCSRGLCLDVVCKQDFSGSTEPIAGGYMH